VYTSALTILHFSDICKVNKFYSDSLVKNVLRRRMQETGAQFFGYDIICGNSAEPLNNLQIRVHAFATPAISVSKPASKTANMQKNVREETNCVVKVEKLGSVANRYVGDLKGTKQAVKALLLRLINGRRAFIQYCQGGPVQDKTNERYALLFS
jgi:hypothetical protein